MAAAPLRFLQLRGPQAETRGLRGQDEHGPQLVLALPGGATRVADLDRGQLVDIIRQAANALAQLDRQENP